MNIILIGMPGCGKSTAGVVLAKRLGYDFLDADLLIQQREGRLLQQIIDNDGDHALLKAEEEALCSIDCDNTVIATGGSAVYSEKGMAHLKQKGTAIHISLPVEELYSRLGNLATRGVAGAANQTIEQIFVSRAPLYNKWADVTVDALGMTIGELTDKIIESLDK